MALSVTHAKTNAITDWTQAQLDAQIALGNYPPGTTLSQITLPSDWNATHTLSGTADVNQGGTGNTTFTAYSVICAGTTSTGAFQNVSGLGTSGQVLTSNGPAALPTWQTVSGTGTVTSVNITQPAAGITASGGPITTSGSITLALADDLAAVEGLASNGIATRTATSTWTTRTITGTSNRISITNGDGVSGNPTIDISSSYVGQASITTLGTITTGVWTGTTIAIANGGTGQTTAANAINALLPTQTGNSGKYLTTDGSVASWGTVSGSGDVVGPGSATDNAVARFDTTTGKLIQNSVVIIDDSGNTSGVGTLACGTTTITSTSATALAVGRQGATAPAFQVDASAGTSVTGLKVTAGASGGGVALNVISSSSAENLTIDALGTNATIGLRPEGVVRYTVTNSRHLYTMAASATAANTRFLVTGATDSSAMTLSTEATSAHFNFAQTRTWATGALTLQRSIRFSGSTMAFSGGSTATDAAVVAIDSYGQAGTNATITNAHGLYIPTQAAAGTVTNMYGITVATPTGGGTLNYALNAGACTIATIDLGNNSDTTLSRSSAGILAVEGVTVSMNSTSATHTAGTIELGNASDTTLSRASAGVLAVEGVNVLTVAGGLLTGSITLGENTGIALDPAGSADGKWSGITIAGTAGYTQAFGDLVYLDPTDSRWEACDANSAQGADGDARGIIGMVVSAGTDGTGCIILLQGTIRADAKFPTFTINNQIYVSETAGLVTQTQPTTTDVVIRVVGQALTADEMYFYPSQDFITHT